MHKFILPLIFSLLIFTNPLYAIDFMVGDFDAAPDDDTFSLEISDEYADAIACLMDEITIIKTDDDGNEILRVMPLPMELIALITQAGIFESLARSEEEIAVHVERANFNKPGPNYFDFIIDGAPEWVGRDVSVWYIPEAGGTEGIMVPVYRVMVDEVDIYGNQVGEWMLVAESPEELQAFLAAAEVKLLIEDEDESIEPMVIDIGFWRMYGLFDLRTEAPVEDETPEPEIESLEEE